MTQAKIHVVIIIQENLEATLAEWFAGLRLEPQVSGATRMAGTLRDQAELHGYLERIRDLNLSLVSVQVQKI